MKLLDRSLFTFLFFCSFLFFSCKTLPQKIPLFTLDYFALFDSGTQIDLYAAIPVQHNKDLALKITEQFLTKKTAQQAIERTKTAYIALNEKNFKLAALGDYPKVFEPFIFSPQNGWQKNNGFYQNSQENGFFLQAAIPQSNLLLVSNSNTEYNLSQKSTDFKAPQNVKTFFAAQNNTQSILFYSPNTKPIISRFFGETLTLPIEYAYGTCTSENTQQYYTIDVYLCITENRLIKPITTLLKTLLKNSPDAQITVLDDSILLVSNLKISIETLAKMR